MVGLDGEIEHASALIHTLRFGNFYREAMGATSYLAFSNTRGPANSAIAIPLMDKHDAGRRSHYLTIQFSVTVVTARTHSGELIHGHDSLRISIEGSKGTNTVNSLGRVNLHI